MNSHCYYVYIMTNDSDTLYIGVTNDIVRRVYEHKHKLVAEGFTSKYNITQLVYYEETKDIQTAIARGKADQGMASEKENCADQVGESKMGRLEF